MVVTRGGTAVRCGAHLRGALNVTPAAGNRRRTFGLVGLSAVTSGGLTGRSPHPATTATSAAAKAVQGRRRTRRVLSAHDRLVGRARMRLEIHVLQALTREVRVELCRGHVGVPEHLLHGAQVA